VFAISENGPCLKHVFKRFAESQPQSPLCLSFPIITGGDAFYSRHSCAVSSHWSYAHNELEKHH